MYDWLTSSATVQGAAALAVNVNVTEPSIISAWDGKYVGSRILKLLKVPVPDEDHGTESSSPELVTP